MDIKFRAWDKVDKVILEWKDYPEKILSAIPRYGGDKWTKRFIVDQYIGIKDSEDNEIYTGDIVEFTYWWFDGNEQETQLIGVIDFEYGSFILSRIENDFFQDHTGFKKGEGKIYFGELTFDEADFVIKGNIHEHPELLKG